MKIVNAVVLCAVAGLGSSKADCRAPGRDEAADRAQYLSAIRSRYMGACYDGNLSAEDRARIIRERGALPPTVFGDPSRFFTDISAWHGDIEMGPAGQAVPVQFTYSFPADSVSWGLQPIGITGQNNLNSKLSSAFGAAAADRGRELIRQALASWRRQNGITYREVRDDGTTQDQSLDRRSNRGDVRIGGFTMGTSSGILAYNAFPDPAGLASVGGSDMSINTSYFDNGTYTNSSNNYRYFRNVVTHEHGHGLGFIHPVPCTQSKLMEPFASSAFDGTQIDEFRAAGANYGDRFAGNHSSGSAKDFGTLTTPAVRSVVERNLSTNGAGAANGTGEDWFKFTLTSTQTVAITVAPVGGTYDNGQQVDGCSGSVSSVNASQAGNLNVELRDSSGNTVIASASGAAAGATETIASASRGAGTYFVRVVDAGPNASVNQRVQLYDLTIRLGSSKAPPLAIAGLHKRIAVGRACYFIGNINSRALDTGATLPASGYAWDLDGNGTFETTGSQPNRVYSAPGIVNVTLRVTDSNSMQAFDTIQVEVFDPEASFTVPGSACPWLSGQPAGTTVPTGDGAPAQAAVQLLDQPVFNSDELRFTVDGQVALSAGGVSIGADGDAASIGCFAPAGFNGVSPLCGPRGALVGVFLMGDRPAPGAGGPAALDFSSPASRDYELLAPGLGQAFFIGDGRTGADVMQRVLVPALGCRLFLGVLDDSGWSDNSGGFAVSVAEAPGFPGPFVLGTPANGVSVATTAPLLTWGQSLGASSYIVTGDNNSDFSSPLFSVNVLQNSIQCSPNTFAIGGSYWWKVTAVNSGGRTTDAGAPFMFSTVPPCPADLNGDRAVNTADLTVLLSAFGSVVSPGTGADVNNDGAVNTADLSLMLGAFGGTCP